eukprot:CAMPEP_0185725192 /NCGR_PEP_ID=MMETSP1171-20130828/1494_1 /TAXON_ID=374046 /ORGANISM="Helicotheca tamensis, Strain CCMP826" /LENGTH=198 /DNA_ID=CAMNT_0028393241 /DNA_START=46 /DNA_END=639 /DNA_ORIENTATION=+
MKKVQFSLENEIFDVISHVDMSDEEKFAAWLTDREQKKLEHSLLKTIKSMRTNGSDCRRCIRGLEHLASSEHSEQREIIRECNTVSVLREQHRQKNLGIYDPDEIRKMSEATSQWSKNTALTLGRADASEAETLLADARKVMKMITQNRIPPSGLYRDISTKKHSKHANKYASLLERTQKMATLSLQEELSSGSYRSQ